MAVTVTHWAVAWAAGSGFPIIQDSTRMGGGGALGTDWLRDSMGRDVGLGWMESRGGG